MFHEINRIFRSRDEWLDWMRRNPWLADPGYINGLVDDVRRHGLYDPLDGFCAPADILIDGANYRETIIARRLNARMRALLDFLAAEKRLRPKTSDVYAPEQVTPFAAVARRLFKDFVGSEYLPTKDDRARHPELVHQDVMDLSFPDRSFDLYFSSEVMEHVPSVERTLEEAHRVLRPRCKMVAMFPFAYAQEHSIVKTRIADGELVELMPAEFHGNPIDPSGGSRVFTIPGWEILDWARQAGFADAYFVARSSRYLGVTGAEIAAVLLFVAQKGGKRPGGARKAKG